MGKILRFKLKIKPFRRVNSSSNNCSAERSIVIFMHFSQAFISFYYRKETN